MTEIDPVEFGKMQQSIKTMEEDMRTLVETVGELKSRLDGGRGVIMGMLIAAGGLGATAHEALARIFK